MPPAMHDPLPVRSPDAMRLGGRLGGLIDRTLDKWTLRVVPYAAFAANFCSGRINSFAGGETWGKAVRAASLHYRYAPTPELREVLRKTVADLLACERENGSVSCVPPDQQPDSAGGDLWERKYVLLGLDAYLRHVEEDPRVLASMVRQVDCLMSQIGPEPKTPITRTGWSANKIESSTILHPVMLLYQRAGEPRFLGFARHIVQQGGCDGYDLIEEAIRRVPPHRMAGGIYPKAYEMMSFFLGVIEYALSTGDARCREAALALFESIRTHEITLIGGAGGDAPYHEHGECWDHTAFEQTNPRLNRTMETCVAVTWMQFCMAIHRLSGDPGAIDEIERTLHNALAGAAHATGTKFSYMNRLNGVKSDPDGWGVWVQGHGVFTCCSLNGPMGFACAREIAITGFGEGVAVNLFIPAEARLTLPSGNRVSVVIETDFPVEDSVRITVRPEVPERFPVRMRVPAWSGETALSADGTRIDALPGSYAVIEREWGGGTIDLRLDLRARAIHSAKDGRVAVVRGPVVFTRDENMDRAFDQPVRLREEAGFVNALAETPFYDAVWQQLRVPEEGGGFIRMVDWASADNWNGRRVCTWMPVGEPPAVGRTSDRGGQPLTKETA